MSGPFGPNSAAIDRFLTRLARMDVADFAGVVRVWRDALHHADDWYAAEDAVGDAIARTRRDAEMWRLQDALYGTFRGGAWYERPLPHGRRAPIEAAAQYLATTAAVTLMVAEALPPQHVATLYAPFAVTIPLHELVDDGARRRESVPERRVVRGDGERPGDRRQRVVWITGPPSP